MAHIQSGKQKPQLMLASEVPAIRSVIKQWLDRDRAISQFNSVYDFMVDANFKYFKQKDFDEHHTKYGTHSLWVRGKIKAINTWFAILIWGEKYA
jgi:predicted SpoU family rRNA methylase